MKKGMRIMAIGLSLLIVAILGLMAFVRLAPSDAVAWNTQPISMAEAAPEGAVQTLTGAATFWLGPDRGEAQALLQRLDTIALATPRTTRLAGTPSDARITWVTRSALWGFPDYTTAEATSDGLYVYARLRFGSEDMGVNAKRLNDWLAQLSR